MTTDRIRFGAPGARYEGRLPGSRTLVLLLVPILLLASVALTRASGLTTRPAAVLAPGAAATMAPEALTASAADLLEQATRKGGTGVTFAVVQRSRIEARPDGEPLELPDATDPTKHVVVEAIPAGTYLERGVVTPAGYFAEISRGPDDEKVALDWEGSQTELAALVRDGRTYRDDGSGWYETAHPPGLGLDPATAALLPTLLRALADPADAAEPAREDDPFAEQAPTRRLAGATRVADIPGIIAVDLAGSTELRGPAELAFDELGRLVGLRIVARNTNLEAYDLLVDTVITFGYPDAVPDLPRPEPAYVAPATPADEQ